MTLESFDETISELSDLFDHYVVVFVLAPVSSLEDQAVLPAAMMAGKLRRGVSGQTFLAAPVLRDEDLTFYVGVDEPGQKSCFFLSPRTFRNARWNDQRSALFVDAEHGLFIVMPLDDHEGQIEAGRARGHHAAAREALEELRREWGLEEAD